MASHMGSSVANGAAEYQKMKRSSNSSRVQQTIGGELATQIRKQTATHRDNREHDDLLDPTRTNHKGNRVAATAQGKRDINEKMNRQIAEAAANVHAKENHKQREKEKGMRKRTYSFSRVLK